MTTLRTIGRVKVAHGAAQRLPWPGAKAGAL
jgi:hypothetical protein